MSTWKLLHGDVREQLAELPDVSVQCIVTSPPYWGLRDYGHAGQIGLEPTPEAFVAALLAVFSDVRRVLKDDGAVWLNLGDSYNSGTQFNHHSSGLSSGARYSEGERGDWPGHRPLVATLKMKDLVGIPWMVAFALRDAGWYLRSDIIWSKPNPMPESVTDRPTKAHEYIFLLTKSARYYYDAAAIREPYSPSTLREFEQGYEGQATKDYDGTGAQNASDVKRRIVEKARKTQDGFPGQSPHSYQLNGQRSCTANRADKQRGHGRRHAGFNDRWDAMPKDEQQMTGANKRSVWHVATQPYPDAHFATFPEALIEPCILAGSRPGDTVLDPFNGSGTTGVVAIRHQRNYIGIELNAAYIALARKRIGAVAPLFADEATA